MILTLPLFPSLDIVFFETKIRTSKDYGRWLLVMEILSTVAYKRAYYTIGYYVVFICEIEMYTV